MEKCTLSEKTLQAIQNSLRFQIDFYGKIFKKHALTNFQARIFGTEKEFVKYAKGPGNYRSLSHSTIAYYSSETHEMILHKEVVDFEKTFSHELSHAILNYYCDDAVWFSEGLSEFFEDIIFLDSTFYFDHDQLEKITYTKSLLREGNSLFDVIFSKDFHRDTTYKNYTLSWAVIYYLYQTSYDLLKELIRSLCDNPQNALELTYPGGIGFLESDIRSYYLNSKPSSLNGG